MGSFSAHVQIELRIGGEKLPVAQAGGALIDPSDSRELQGQVEGSYDGNPAAGPEAPQRKDGRAHFMAVRARRVAAAQRLMDRAARCMDAARRRVDGAARSVDRAARSMAAATHRADATHSART